MDKNVCKYAVKKLELSERTQREETETVRKNIR